MEHRPFVENYLALPEENLNFHKVGVALTFWMKRW